MMEQDQQVLPCRIAMTISSASNSITRGRETGLLAGREVALLPVKTTSQGANNLAAPEIVQWA